MSRHARVSARVQQGHLLLLLLLPTHTHILTHTHLDVPDNQQPQTGHQGQVQRDVNVFHHSQQ